MIEHFVKVVKVRGELQECVMLACILCREKARKAGTKQAAVLKNAREELRQKQISVPILEYVVHQTSSHSSPFDTGGLVLLKNTVVYARSRACFRKDRSAE